ncbi:hypothetical protein SUREIYA_01620 [Serratia phage vB_SmaM-Sureiya]|nr:hypothetical protein SUREIYA_01620 [Serratia phage vB_SmaM-Sureiya]
MPTHREPTIEFVSLTSIVTNECMGWVEVYNNKLIIRVNGVTRIKRTKTESRINCHMFRTMFAECLGTGETLHKAKSRYKFIVSDKFKSGIGKNFI